MSSTDNYSGSISVGTVLISRTVPGELRQQMRDENLEIVAPQTPPPPPPSPPSEHGCSCVGSLVASMLIQNVSDSIARYIRTPYLCSDKHPPLSLSMRRSGGSVSCMCIRETVLGHIQSAKTGYFVQVWLVRRPKQTQSASTPMYNIVMTFFSCSLLC